MKKKFLREFAATACLLCGLASCKTATPVDSSKAPEESIPTSSEIGVKKAALIDSYALGEKSDNAYGGYNANFSQINLYSNNVYEYIETTMVYGYSMNMSTTVLINYGTYAKGTSEDGVTSYSMNKAARVFLNSFSKAGGFHIDIDSDKSTYPVELPAKTQGEKNMANNKAEVIAQYGAGFKAYAYDGKAEFSFIDPNAEEGAKEEVTTASGDISSFFANDIADINVVSQFAKGGYGDSSWNGDCYALVRFADNSYEFINTTVQYGYSMVLGATTNITYGSLTKGTSEDGVTEYTLNKADDVSNLSYSKAGGFSLKTMTMTEQTYPVELPAKTQGEKNMANNKAEVIDQLGASRTVYAFDTNNELSLTNPNE